MPANVAFGDPHHLPCHATIVHRILYKGHITIDVSAKTLDNMSYGQNVASSCRSPDRPNPIGLHSVTVREVAGNRLRIGPIEVVDGTPVVDIKPVDC